MRKLGLCLLFTTLCQGAEITAQEAFNETQKQIARQLSAVANYTCVLTVDRTLYVDEKRHASACETSASDGEKPYMHDRLRLDVAVSEGNEIFSWHGGRKFSSAGVNDLVKSGPISSGSFFGYLRNILFTPGVAISLNRNGTDQSTYKFDYYVPLKSSAYQIQGRNGSFIVPYHGSFTVRRDSFELQSLSVAAGQIPRAAEVCSAQTDILYQKAEISGKALLIPKSFQLHLLDNNLTDTFSQSEYTQCREFRGESTIRFEFDDSAGIQAQPIVQDEWLPAGIDLHIRLSTTLSDQSSFTGDPVEGVLLNSLRLRKRSITVPKGAVVTGVVSRMEYRYQPRRRHIVSIHWDRLTFGPNSLLLNAHPKQLIPQPRRLGPGYAGGRTNNAADDTGDEDTFTWSSNHFRMDQRFAAHYETAEKPVEAPAKHER
jgi:hypothetical protein